MNISNWKALTALILLSTCVACQKKEETKTESPRGVYTFTVPDIEQSRTRIFTGVSKPSEDIALSFRVGGKLVEYPLKEGQKIYVGDLVAKLDDSDFQIDVKSKTANLAQANGQLEKAKMDYERSRILYETSNISKSVLEQSQTAFISAKAQFDNAKAALEISQKQIGYSTLTSPVKGFVSSAPLANYQTVQAGQMVAKIAVQKFFKMEIGIPETLISEVHLNDIATIVFAALPDKKFSAAVTEIGVAPGQSSAYLVMLTITEKDERLRAGMAGEVFMKFKAHQQHILIPTTGIITGPDHKSYVWIYVPSEERVTKRYITTGELTPEGIEVISGLTPGEIVVTKGVRQLREGMKVRQFSLKGQ